MQGGHEPSADNGTPLASIGRRMGRVSPSRPTTKDQGQRRKLPQRSPSGSPAESENEFSAIECFSLLIIHVIKATENMEQERVGCFIDFVWLQSQLKKLLLEVEGDTFPSAP